MYCFVLVPDCVVLCVLDVLLCFVCDISCGVVCCVVLFFFLCVFPNELVRWDAQFKNQATKAMCMARR